MTRRWPLALLVVTVAGCGSAPDVAAPSAASSTAPSTASSAAPATYEAVGPVLESPEHGPELCLGGMADSLPPQCGGVPISNWDWDAVEDEESVNGTTWGAWSVAGTYDGTRLTLTEPPRPVSRPAAAPADPIGTPCPVPAGGWRVEYPGRIDDGALQAALALAHGSPEHAGLWVDYTDPQAPGQSPSGLRILNVAVTGDTAAAERALREVWGGPLCVVQHAHPLAHLRAVQDELMTSAAELGLEPTGSSVDEVRGVVELGVVAVDDAQRAALDARYGAGVVEAQPGLRLRSR